LRSRHFYSRFNCDASESASESLRNLLWGLSCFTIARMAVSDSKRVQQNLTRGSSFEFTHPRSKKGARCKAYYDPPLVSETFSVYEIWWLLWFPPHPEAGVPIRLSSLHRSLAFPGSQSASIFCRRIKGFLLGRVGPPSASSGTEYTTTRKSNVCAPTLWRCRARVVCLWLFHTQLAVIVCLITKRLRPAGRKPPSRSFRSLLVLLVPDRR
jgi:hypothetical protein